MTTHITKTWFDGKNIVTKEIPEAEIYNQEIAADPKASYGFPSGSVSTPNAGGKCVTDGETSPIAELWAALTAYQPHADNCGHGKSWRKMCEARTKDAAGVAASHAVVYASSTNVAADAAHIVWAGGDLGVAIAKIKSITR